MDHHPGQSLDRRPPTSPGEVLSKVISIQRRFYNRTALSFPHNSPVTRAFEAIKTALLLANRNWIHSGPLAFGPLGQIGTASDEVARLAWTKATDGKVKQFSDGSDTNGYGPGFVEVDAGRVVGPATFRGAWNGANAGGGVRSPEDGPPGYVPPSPQHERPPINGADEGGGPIVDEVEQARMKLAQMREQRLRLEEAEEERKRMLEIERKEMEQAIANAVQSHVGPTTNHGTSESRSTTTA